MVKRCVIIVAGGKGNRFKSEIPKQFVNLNGLPVLMHSINAFYKFDNLIHIIVVLPKDQLELWENLCHQHHFDIKHQIVTGGEFRFHSVKNALALAKSAHLVAIHDAVRPLIDIETITTCFETAQIKGNAIPIVELVDSIRKINADGSNFIEDRSKFCLIQTPQVFKTELILEAFNQDFNPLFTDDASVLESIYRGTINLVKGDRQNIKITTPEDLIYAEAILTRIIHTKTK